MSVGSSLEQVFFVRPGLQRCHGWYVPNEFVEGIGGGLATVSMPVMDIIRASTALSPVMQAVVQVGGIIEV
jgi:hypothetical protein